MHRVVHRAVKSSVCVKKTIIAHNFFVTKATDLEIRVLKNPLKMDEETCVKIIYLFKTNIFFYIFSTLFWHFFNPP